MKTSNILSASILTHLSSSNLGFSQEKILAGEKWEKLTKQKFLADFFKDFFVNLGVEVVETGEKITVLHKGDHFEIVQGINEKRLTTCFPSAPKTF
ncbi:MAG: hypothetical protein IPN76_16615 [Saprospiraceae bacterium]|nr:hypothetical protein [Saprospiraceae bacterium]